ncbi:hypothetical protein Zmor_023559 [Zophobas morio]|uniref:Tyr recombinase domain-containing protein n=1 Tax=Zophobas morio TaxID=2755281 RepID=A0AA38HXI6_9CUCU|nr:hypothetical protein Zmor_023559 [Zophobas morio]
MDAEIDDKEGILMDPPLDIKEEVETATTSLLPVKSGGQYERAYKQFMDWRRERDDNSFSENVLLAYFQRLSKNMKPSSLWAIYSMLRTTINLKHNIDIKTYTKLCEFLKRMSAGYKPKKSKILTPQQIKEFLSTAPDEKYLFIKVGLIFGIMGACRRDELMKIEVNHVEDLKSALLVHIPDTESKPGRQFVIGGNFYHICKKYMDLRPPQLVNVTRFFLNYQRGKCTKQPIGINKFGTLASQVATFLKLPNPTCYTGHYLRRASAKRRGGWRSTSVGESYTDHSLNNKNQTGNRILHIVGKAENVNKDNSDNADNTNFEICGSAVINFEVSESTVQTLNEPAENETKFDCKNLGKATISFNNCQNFSNVTINVYLPK